MKAIDQGTRKCKIKGCRNQQRLGLYCRRHYDEALKRESEPDFKGIPIFSIMEELKRLGQASKG